MRRSLPLLVSALLLPSCQQTGLIVPDAGSSPDGGAEPALRQLTYTPEGCGYQVHTPELDETGMSEDVFADDDRQIHIHVSWAGPSHTTFAVNWQSAPDTLASRVLYATDRAAVEAAEGPGGEVLEQVGHHMFFRPMVGGGTRIHEAHVCGLAPSTTYFYKVGGPGHWSQVFDVTTAPEPGSTEPFSFAVTGDSRNNLENSWPICQRRLLEAGIDFELFSGDAVFLGINQNDWRAFFSASDGDFTVQDLMARAPFMMANGNHDQLAVNYVVQFAFPQEISEGEGAQGEEWYSFQYGNAFFVVLNDTVNDSAVLAGSQGQWLRRELMRVDRRETPWVFVMHHRPFHTCRSTHSPDTALRAAWQPIFDELAVDMVFTGHNHVYERSRPIRGLEGGEGVVATTGPNGVPTYDPSGLPSGTVYVVAAGVGAELYEVSSECQTSYTAQSTRPYIIIEIEDRTLRYAAYDAMNGQVIDTFVLTK